MSISFKSIAAISSLALLGFVSFSCATLFIMAVLTGNPRDVSAVTVATSEPTSTALPTSTPQPTLTIDPVKARQDVLERQFSRWDGSHRELVAYTKLLMHNPDSFKHIETRFLDEGETLLLIMTFEGTNAFGATVRSQIKARADVNTGNILEIVE